MKSFGVAKQHQQKKKGTIFAQKMTGISAKNRSTHFIYSVCSLFHHTHTHLSQNGKLEKVSMRKRKGQMMISFENRMSGNMQHHTHQECRLWIIIYNTLDFYTVCLGMARALWIVSRSGVSKQMKRMRPQQKAKSSSTAAAAAVSQQQP